MKRILAGESPTAVFKEMLVDRPQLTNGDLAVAFHDEFPATGQDAFPFIWKWKRVGSTYGLDDERLDLRLMHLLRQAGYLPSEGPTESEASISEP